MTAQQMRAITDNQLAIDILAMKNLSSIVHSPFFSNNKIPR